MTIPFLNLQPAHAAIRAEMQQAFGEVYDSNWFILGNKLSNFEAEYAAFSNVRHAVGVSNGLDALFLALKVLNIGPGDEVIVPSNTYIATALAVSHTGARPVYAEPDARTYNIDPVNIEPLINSRTKAIITVHLYGQACNMDTISSIASAHKLHIIEDNAQAHGATWNNRITGSWGTINATSFYPGKNLGALGDGGALTTNNASLAADAKMLRNYGSEEKYVNKTQGYNMRLDELQAAFLSVKLKHLATWTQQRQQIAAWYHAGLSGTPGIILPYTQPGATHVYHLFVIRTSKRNELMTYLASCGIGTLIHYPIPLYMQEAYKEEGYKSGDFPIAGEMAASCLSLPLWPGMSEGEVMFVVDAIKKFFYA